MSELEKLWTPGPWEYSRDINVVWGDLNCSRSQPGCSLAVARMVVKHSDENIEANAHLIAAAPELYEALEHAMIVLFDVAKTSGLTHSDAISCAIAAQDALAKARGEM